MLIRNVLLGLAAATLFTACHALYSFWPRPPTDFGYVCQQIELMYEVGCGTLEAPTVVYSDIINSASGWGYWHGVYYHGESYIFINPQSPVDMQNEILLHEMTHYVLYELQLIPDNETCEQERVAREISGGIWGNAEKRVYGCTNKGI